MDTYAIKNIETGEYLMEISLDRKYGFRSDTISYANGEKTALRFSEEEALAVVQFIGDVIDWEEAENLKIVDMRF